jgi:hypothetical protein
MSADFLEIIPLDEINDDVEELLDMASGYQLDYALVLGQTKDGKWFFAASEEDPKRAMYTTDSFRSYMTDL